MKWIPKNPKASTDTINAHGPKFVRGSNLAAWFLSYAGFFGGKTAHVISWMWLLQAYNKGENQEAWSACNLWGQQQRHSWESRKSLVKRNVL